MLPGHYFLSGFFLFPSLCVAFILSVQLFPREELMASGSSCSYELLLLLLLSRFSRVWLCATPIDGSLPGSPVPGILQVRILDWDAISFSNAWKWKVKVKPLSPVWLLATPWTAAYQASPSMGFSRQEYWSGLPLPSNIITVLLEKAWSLSSISMSKMLEKSDWPGLGHVSGPRPINLGKGRGRKGHVAEIKPFLEIRKLIVSLTANFFYTVTSSLWVLVFWRVSASNVTVRYTTLTFWHIHLALRFS